MPHVGHGAVLVTEVVALVFLCGGFPCEQRELVPEPDEVGEYGLGSDYQPLHCHSRVDAPSERRMVEGV